jgi:hypothetical protein
MSMVGELIAGDTLDFTDSVSGYPATDGWTLKYRLVPRFTTPTQVPITLTATTVNVTDYRVQATSVATSAWAPGAYAWARWVEKLGERQSLGDGQLSVKIDIATAPQGTDTRTQAERALEDLRAAYATFDGTRSEYTIAGRTVKFAQRSEIIAQMSYWATQVKRERRSAALSAGLPDPSILYLRGS